MKGSQRAVARIEGERILGLAHSARADDKSAAQRYLSVDNKSADHEVYLLNTFK